MPSHTGLFGGSQRKTVSILRKKPNKELVEALQLHAGLILRSAARVTGSMDEAKDVAQDLAEKLLRKPPKEVRSWPAYLKTMAVNASIDRIRRRRETSEPIEVVSLDSPESVLSQEEMAGSLRRAVAQLSQRDAQIFSLCYMADLSHADIGRQMDMKSNAVSVALHRIRKQLSAILKSEETNEIAVGELS